MLENDDMAARAQHGLIVGFEPMNPQNKKVCLFRHNFNVVIRKTFKEIPISVEDIALLNSKSAPDKYPILSMQGGFRFEEVSDDEDAQEAQAALNAKAKPAVDMYTAYGKVFAAAEVLRDDDTTPEPVKVVEEMGNQESSSMLNDGNITLTQALAKYTRDIIELAVLTEMFNLEKTLQFISSKTPLSPDTTFLPSKIFFREKFDANGVFIKLKARVVCMGNLQKEGSYGRTSAPTVDTEFVLFILSLRKQIPGSKIATVDIPAAYLNADLEEDITLMLPKDLSTFLSQIDANFAEILTSKGILLAKLLKSLYGLKQAGANWHAHIRNTLLSMGFKSCSSDTCLFFRGLLSSKDLVLIVLHVDDLLFVYQRDEDLDQIAIAMSHVYGPLEFCKDNISFLGMNVVPRENGDVFLNQPGYAMRICASSDTKGVASTPSTASLFSDIDQPAESYAGKSREFKSKLMSLMFLTRTRPDILKECVFLAAFSLLPGPRAFQKLVRVYQYIRGTLTAGITLGANSTNLVAYGDASYAVHVNGRSHSGIYLTFGPNSGPIFVKSKVQKMVTLSSTEAELVTLVDCVKACIPFHQALQDLQIPTGPIIVKQDNQSTIHIVVNGEGYSGKNRHMRVRYGLVHELLQDKSIVVEYIPTGSMIADILTKPMGGILFRTLRAAILNTPEEAKEEDQEEGSA